MADIIINRIEKTVHIITEYINRTYSLFEDNVFEANKYYVITIDTNGNRGKIILPCDKTNVIVIG